MPGFDADILHVSGQCEVESPSVTLGLEPTNEGVSDDPHLVALRFTADRRRVVSESPATKTATWQGRVAGARRVRITGEVNATIDVAEIG